MALQEQAFLVTGNKDNKGYAPERSQIIQVLLQEGQAQ
jgi:hypothetical protein